MHSQQDVNIRKVVAEACKQSFEYVFFSWIGEGGLLYTCAQHFTLNRVSSTQTQ